MFRANVVEKSKPRFTWITFFFFEKHAFYEAMWKNVVEPDRPQVTIHGSCHTNWQSNTTVFYYNLLSQGYMFRLLRVIIRPSNEPIQDYLITSALWDPVALTIGSVIVVWTHVNRTNYSVLVKYIWLLYGYKVTSIMTTILQDFSGSSLCSIPQLLYSRKLRCGLTVTGTR
jgi:hypothetical protein